MKFMKWLRGKSRADLYENVSFVGLGGALAMTVLGISIGTYVSGFPVAVAMAGAFLSVVGIALFIAAEFYRILKG